MISNIGNVKWFVDEPLKKLYLAEECITFKGADFISRCEVDISAADSEAQ